MPVSGPRPSRRMHDGAARESLIVSRKASDRICGKRLRPMVPLLVESMERHGHRQLAPKFRTWPLANSAATIDRALKQANGLTGAGARRRSSPSALRPSIPYGPPMVGTTRHLATSKSTWSRITGFTAEARWPAPGNVGVGQRWNQCRSSHRDARPWPTSTGHSHRPPVQVVTR